MSFQRSLGAGMFVATVIACSSASSPGFDNPGTSSSDGSGGGNFGSSEAGASATSARCSADLHSVLAGDGTVISQCPLTEGCAAGKCVPACDAASANRSSLGCDYFALPPPFATCFAAFVANTWGRDVTLSARLGAEVLDVNTFTYLPNGSGAHITYTPLKNGIVPAGKVAIVFLNDGAPPTCPAGIRTAKAVADVLRTGVGKAFRLTTDAPTVAYDIYPYGGGETAITSASLLLPTTAWGDNYVGITAYPANTGTPWLAFAAKEDGTEVTVSPTSAIVAGPGVSGTARGVPVVYTLNAGDYIKIQQRDDLIGSTIQATKPIGSWAGNTCAQVPTGQVACDSLHQQVPPVRSFGSRYVGVHYRDRYEGTPESPPYRIIGAVHGTTLHFSPPIPGAPTAIGAGEVVEFRAGPAFVVKSQDDAHPFYLASYMSGCQDAGAGPDPADCRGDPEFVNVIPDAQYLASYTFFTDPTYSETNLVFVRRKDQDGRFRDVSLDCMGTLEGWVDIAGTDFQWTRADLQRGNFQKQGNCDNGVHEAKSEAPFGLTVWGWGSAASTPVPTQAVSYGYPAGAGMLPVNTVVVPAVPK